MCSEDVQHVLTLELLEDVIIIIIIIIIMMMYVCEGIVNLAIVESISMDLSFAFDVLSGFVSHFNDVLTFSFMDMNFF